MDILGGAKLDPMERAGVDVEDDLDGAWAEVKYPWTYISEDLCQASVVDVTGEVTF